jgi:sugar/nucleoside kinase (ribokinase family)
MKTFYGGAAANVATVSATLGLKSSLISAVGGDFRGSDYQNCLKGLYIDIEDMIVVEDEKTPTAFVMTDATGDQISYFYWGAAKYFKDFPTPVKAIKKARAVHLATGDPSFNGKCGETANKYDKLVSFDPGQDLHMYSPENLKKVLKICNILFGNHHEIDRILQILEMDIKELQDMGPEIIVKTKGKDGSIIYADQEIKIEAKVVDSIDPTGGGDSYRAGFLKAYLSGESLEFCGNFASSVASFVVEAEGCQTNIPNYDIAIKRMRQ